MTYTRKNTGVCSRSTTVVLEEGVIQSIEVEDGCEGSLKGVCALLVGLPAADGIARLKGVLCETKATSCPDQIARCLEEALQQG